MATHESRLASVQSEVKGFYERKEKFRIYHGSTNSTRRAKWKRSQVVDTSGLTHILNIDTTKKVAVVEPNVPMDALVAATLTHGLVPPVVPEFPGITVGGAVVGSAGESSSFKFGLVDRTVESVELVLADGEVLTASATENEDLFAGIGSSFGTLGVLTQVTMRLIPAKEYVEVTYHSVGGGYEDACQKLLDCAVDPRNDFVDGIVYGRQKSVIVTAKFTDAIAGKKIQTFSRASDPWFYLHARSQFTSSPYNATKTDIVPLTDYLFRYDRGGFWVGRYAYRYFCVPFDWLSRFVMNWFMHTRILYHALHESGLGEEYIVQDLALPRRRAPEFLEYAFGQLMPTAEAMWICPLQKRPTAVMNPRQRERSIDDKEGADDDGDGGKGYPEIINIGVWGPGSRNRDTFIEQNRALEKKVASLGGIKWLYAQTFYTESEFWEIYDRDGYDALRVKYRATGLPNVFDKVGYDFEGEKRRREEARGLERWKEGLKGVWPVRGVYGVLKTLVSKEYLLLKEGKSDKAKVE